jgi:hypothetical protein
MSRNDNTKRDEYTLSLGGARIAASHAPMPIVTDRIVQSREPRPAPSPGGKSGRVRRWIWGRRQIA